MVYLFHGPLHDYPNDIADCRRWFALFASLACIPMFSIDALSMIRIYVLHQRSFKIAILVTVSTSLSMKTVDFSPTCDALDTKPSVLFFGAWVVMTQLALIWLTFQKLKSISGKLHASTVYLVLYQGMWLCFLLIVIIIGTLSYAVTQETSNPNIVSIWPSTFTSTLFCRVVQFTSWFSSPSEATQELKSRDGTSTLRRRFRLSIDSEHRSPHRVSSSPNSSDASESPLPVSEGRNSEAGISLSDVGLQGALPTMSSLQSNSIQ
ncbi:hypothetical protein BKA70DRAFT_1345469 [Coprinopsis sp. MPI-PUGE-AT-0042]|nr:hypothetical protein BKA70DRAFT_1345469 [Coprinopsis sp. MPI-PUGE-AT-0042]